MFAAEEENRAVAEGLSAAEEEEKVVTEDLFAVW